MLWPIDEWPQRIADIEAASGIPLVSAPWDDSEHLFRRGDDFLMARNGADLG